MKIIFSKKKLIQILKGQKNLGFVPTMGAIHKAHIYILKKSISLCNKTIVTIFVNKPQFNKITDYKKYPENLKKDISILRKCKVDYLYLPSTKQIYPFGSNTKIKISVFSKKLCGKFRPGHFEAVVDVIDRFIRIIKPNKIFLGEKDMQQLKIIEEFINKNQIFQLGVKKVDYIELIDINKQIKPFKKNKKYKLFIAYYLGAIRLIDNIQV